jgi:hypothetical protein
MSTKTIQLLNIVPRKIRTAKFNLWYQVGHSYLGHFFPMLFYFYVDFRILDFYELTSSSAQEKHHWNRNLWKRSSAAACSCRAAPPPHGNKKKSNNNQGQQWTHLSGQWRSRRADDIDYVGVDFINNFRP